MYSYCFFLITTKTICCSKSIEFP